MEEHGATRLYAKPLAENDNSKQQIYLGTDFSALNVIPFGDFEGRTGARGERILRAPVDLRWVTDDHSLVRATHTQLILYPQYPEVRLSGFLRGAAGAPNALMRPTPRVAGRVMFFGVREDRSVLAYVAAPNSYVAREYRDLDLPQRVGLFVHVPPLDGDSCSLLLRELCRIHNLGWINGKRLRADGTLCVCNARNCGGCTLEAELGIASNADAKPDYRGWEVKAYTVTAFAAADRSQRLTVMTPEPTGGAYRDLGFNDFMRTFGYRSARTADRYDFTGSYFFDQIVARTGLTLRLLGYDVANGRITDNDGGIALMTQRHRIAAFWGFAKLIRHWADKHPLAVYVPVRAQAVAVRRYHYGPSVRLCRGAEFRNVLRAIVERRLFFDPGMHLENASTRRPIPKKRSQFRVGARHIPSLYEASEVVGVCDPCPRQWRRR